MSTEKKQTTQARLAVARLHFRSRHDLVRALLLLPLVAALGLLCAAAFLATPWAGLAVAVVGLALLCLLLVAALTQVHWLLLPVLAVPAALVYLWAPDPPGPYALATVLGLSCAGALAVTSAPLLGGAAGLDLRSPPFGPWSINMLLPVTAVRYRLASAAGRAAHALLVSLGGGLAMAVAEALLHHRAELPSALVWADLVDPVHTVALRWVPRVTLAAWGVSLLLLLAGLAAARLPRLRCPAGPGACHQPRQCHASSGTVVILSIPRLQLPEASLRQWAFACARLWAAVLALCGVCGWACAGHPGAVIFFSAVICLVASACVSAGVWPRAYLLHDERGFAHAALHVESLLPHAPRRLFLRRYALSFLVLSVGAATPWLVSRLLAWSGVDLQQAPDLVTIPQLTAAACALVFGLWPLGATLIMAGRHWRWPALAVLGAGLLLGMRLSDVPCPAVSAWLGFAALLAVALLLCDPEAWPMGRSGALHTRAALLAYAVGLAPGIALVAVIRAVSVWGW